MGHRRQNLTTDDGVRLTLHRLGPRDAPPVLLMAGTFSNHTFWLGTRGHGLAWELGRAGFEASVLDPRGHGESDRPPDRRARRRWSFDDWGRHDVPTAIRAVASPDRPALLVGHSAGGAALLIALAAEPDVRDRVAGIVTLATPVPWLQRWRRGGAWAIAAGSRLLGRFPARRMGLGPEDELPGVMAQWMRWNLRGEWVGRDGVDYVRRLADVSVPVFGMSGAGDRVFAPPDACRALVAMVGAGHGSYELAGRETGYSEDFDHPGIIISRAARTEVWPRVIEWLRQRTN